MLVECEVDLLDQTLVDCVVVCWGKKSVDEWDSLLDMNLVEQLVYLKAAEMVL